MGLPKKVRDPIHNFIHLAGREVDIVDTQLFQRLRGIRQLAFSSLVYPGAVHTRFDHSLGVCHVAGLIARELGLTDEDQNLLRRAALLHDVGHGPFSHVAENALELFANRDLLREDVRKEKIHELVTSDAIMYSEELGTCLARVDVDNIRDLLSKGHGEPVMKAIISGPLDADKQDYLLRDSYFCGVRYGVFDLHQLIRVLRKEWDQADQSLHLMIGADGIHALEQFVLAKYYITNQVYRHKVRLISDEMFLRAIKLGIEQDEIEELKRIFGYDGTPEFMQEYMKWSDSNFIVSFTDDEFTGKHCHSLLTRLKRRNLLRRVYHKRISELPEASRLALASISNPEKRILREKVEARVFEALRGSGAPVDPPLPQYVIVHSYVVSSVREQTGADEGSIVVWRRPTPTTFDQESFLFRSINAQLSETFIEVYASVRYTTEQQKRDLLNKSDQPITEVLGAVSVADDGAGARGDDGGKT